MKPFRRFLVFSIALLCAAKLVSAADPSLARINPRGANRGVDTEITLTGQHLRDAQEILFYESGITVKKIEGAEGGRSAKAVVSVASDAPVGEHHLRLRTASGISEMRTFFISALPAVDEKEPNNDFSAAQKIDLNVTVNGVVANEDVDHYVVEAKKGQRLSVEVEGLRASPVFLDPFIMILDEDQKELASDDDSSLLAQDPLLSIVVPKDGRYVVQVRDSAYGGNNEATYRLHVGTFPRPTAVFPAGGQAGQSVSVQFIGDPLGTFSKSIRLPAEPRERLELVAEQDGQLAPSPNVFRVSALANVIEAEPNDTFDNATRIEGELPLAFNGIIEKAGDCDVFKFRAKKGQQYHINVFARRLRSPLDPVLKIQRGSKAIGGDDDMRAGNPDCYMKWNVPEDGEYAIVVTDHLGHGGPDYVYRVEVTPGEKKLSLMLPYFDQNNGKQERQAIVIPRGNRFATPLRILRTEYGGPVELMPQDFPAGVSIQAAPVGDGVDSVPVVFEASKDASVGGKLAGLIAKSTQADIQVIGGFTQSVNLVPEGNNRPFYEVEVEKLAIAVAEEAPFSIDLVQPKAPIVQGGSMELKVVAKRKDGFTAPIRLQMIANPPGVNAGSGEINEGKTESFIPLNAEEGAATRKSKVAVLGSADTPDGRVWVSTQLGELEVAQPMLAMSIPNAVIKRGESGKVIVNIDRAERFEGKAKVKLVGLPANVLARPEEIEISSDDKTATFNIQTSNRSPAGQHKSLLCVVTVMKDGEPVIHNLARGGVLRIDAPQESKQVAAKKN